MCKAFDKIKFTDDIIGFGKTVLEKKSYIVKVEVSTSVMKINLDIKSVKLLETIQF